MAMMTDEEADALDEYYTQNPPRVDPAKKGTGFFTRRMAEARTVTLDKLSADYLVIKAIAENKTPAEVIGDLVREKLSAPA